MIRWLFPSRRNNIKKALGAGQMLWLIVVLCLSLVPLVNVSADVESVNLGTTVVSEGDDFFTQVIGLPLDMSSDPYPDFPTTLANVSRNSFSASNGIWSFNSTNSDPNVWLLWPSIQHVGGGDLQKVLRLGDRFPINAGKYKLLSFRLCAGTSTYANVYWYDQALGFPATEAGSTTYINISSGCKVYTIHMGQIAKYMGTWSGTVHGFRLDPATTATSLQLDWARLTTASTSSVVPINWSNINSGSTLHFYLNSSCSASGATKIGTQTRSGSSGTFNWGSSLQSNGSAATPYPLPESFQPGTYTVVMLVDGAGSPMCPTTSLQIHKAPLLTILRPSMASGPDYATNVVGNPWGMNDSADVVSTSGITSYNFNGGIFNATTNSSGDPQYLLHVTNPIDTSKYKYLTFRYYLEGIQNVGLGWVHRTLWWYKGVGIDQVTTRDMVIYEGWHTYSIDLSQAPIEPPPYSLSSGWNGTPSGLRMDPDEMPNPMNFHVDFVTLTGDLTAKSGTPFSIVYQTTPATGVSVTFYYDTDTNPNNGRWLMGSYSAGAAPPGFKVFVPMVTSSSAPPEIDPMPGDTWVWNTAVSAGTYYVSADVNDGVMTTTWYSETPVIVTR
jgi:hypothetical protein